MRIDENKSIGTVIFIVEGQRFEFSIIDRIFKQIFKYEYHEKRRGKSSYLNKGKNPTSKVYVLNAESSNLDSLENIAYLDQIYEELSNEFHVNIDDSAIFFLFDRDPKSNVKFETGSTEDKYLKLHNYYSNPWENDDNRVGGQLLLSYPSMESYEISNFIDESHNLKYGLGKDLKWFINSNHSNTIQLNKISLTTIEHATKEFINFINERNILVDLDNLGDVSTEVYNYEERYYDKYTVYRVLSMLTIAFIQLGMIVIEEGDINNFVKTDL